MPLNTPPLGYTGEQVEFSTNPTVKPGIVRAATATEAAAGTRSDIFISPATAQSAIALDFASPPVLGYGSTTPRPVAATTITSTSITSASGGITATTGNITAAAGNIAATLGSVAAGTTVSAGTSVSATTSVTAGTTVTATLGNITATNGNLVLGTIGNKIVIPTGSNASVGTSGVMSGTPGVVTVATTACSATAKVFYCRATTGGTPGNVSITAQDGTGFTLTSTGNETSTFNWWIINA